MSDVHEPLGRRMTADIDGERVDQLWSGTLRTIKVRKQRRRTVSAVALAAVFAIVGGLARDLVGREPAGALVLEAGAAPATVTTADAGTVLHFADDSEITVGSQTQLVPVENDGHSFVARLDSGWVDVEVTPGGPRRWTIDAGRAVVEVVGTAFRVEREGDAVRVAVRRGRVEVHGEGVPGGRRQLGLGQTLVVPPAPPATPPAMPPEASAQPALDVAPTEPTPEEVTATPAPVASRRAPAAREEGDWRELAERGEHRAAYDSLPPSALDRDAIARMAARELMLLADVARLSGHAPEAVPPLERILEHHSRSPEAPLAATILARVEHDRGRHARAAQILEIAIDRGLPSALADGAHGQLLRELTELGDRPRCAAESRRYLDVHPTGRHTALARACLGE